MVDKLALHICRAVRWWRLNRSRHLGRSGELGSSPRRLRRLRRLRRVGLVHLPVRQDVFKGRDSATVGAAPCSMIWLRQPTFSALSIFLEFGRFKRSVHLT